MTIFSLKNTKIFNSLKVGNIFLIKYSEKISKCLLAISLLLFLLFVFGFLGENIQPHLLRNILGLVIFSISLFFLFWRCSLFFNFKIKQPNIKGKLSNALENDSNLAEFLSYDSADAIMKSIAFSKKNNLNEINSSHLFYFLLKNNPSLNFIFYRALVDTKRLRSFLKQNLLENNDSSDSFSEDFQNTITSSARIAILKNHQRIEITDLITALADENIIFKKVLIDAQLKSSDINDLSLWLESIQKETKERKNFWSTKNLRKKGSIAKDWSSGYTNMLGGFSKNITSIIRMKGYPEIVGHQKEVKEIERALSEREMNNVLLIGETGSGRSSIIEEVAVRSDLGLGLPSINYKKFIQLNLNSLIAEVQNRESITTTLDNVFREVISAGNVVLVINDFHFYIGKEKSSEGISLEGIIVPYLNSPNFRIIAISDVLNFRRLIEVNPSFSSLFRKIDVAEISEKESLIVLENLVAQLEKKYKVFISFRALKEIINSCSKYIQSAPFPEKAIDLLDETVAFVSQSKEKQVLSDHVNKIVFAKTKIPVGDLETREKEILLNLEDLIHERIVNQEKAVEDIASALRRARSGVSSGKGPMGSFLFLGPTGVGKTETAKALSDIFFGSEESMIRLDMSEFQNIEDVEKILGSENFDGLLTTKVRENPFSLLLLDEIEKAHPNILNLFLQVLDEGYITDGLGRKVNFNNIIIIATSNAGYKVILEAIKGNSDWSDTKAKLLDNLFQNNIFRPEFINRFDSVVVFGPLSREHLITIAGLMLGKVKKALKEKDINLNITEPLKEKLAEVGYDPTFGAREMKRAIQDKVEDPLAKVMINGEISGGDNIEIDPETFEVKKI